MDLQKYGGRVNAMMSELPPTPDAFIQQCCKIATFSGARLPIEK
jgi:hypothetical protein